jgi:hypothetical protein
MVGCLEDVMKGNITPLILGFGSLPFAGLSFENTLSAIHP